MSKPVPTRSCSAELTQGSVDGSYKQVVKDRGGVVESATWESRKELSTAVYGIVELAEKMLPATDGGPSRTVYTTDTPTPGILVSDQR
jgi:hypothetical protein